MLKNGVAIFGCIFLAATVLSLSRAATISTRENSVRNIGKAVENYYQVDRDGRYIMRYETPNGIIHFETGYMRRSPDGSFYQVKEGYYIYPTADGRKVRLAYFADHEGYRVIAYEVRDSPFEETDFHNHAESIGNGIPTSEEAVVETE